MTSIDRMVTNAQSYASSFVSEPLAARPATRVAVVACMDARLNVFELLGLSRGDAHVIRNAGGVITDDVIRSLMISQRLLGTNEIMLVHHTRCGMAAIDEEAVRDEIEAETGTKLPFALEAFTDVDDSVRRSVERLAASPFLVSTNVRGFVYDVDDGTLREVLSP
jgi:carbonic anhydrase